MKKQVSTVTLALGLLAGVAGFSQNPAKLCGTYEAMEMHFQSDPAARQNYEALQNMLQQQQTGKYNPAQTNAAFEYTIPVVFHVLYTHTTVPASDAEILNALDQINKDFARLGSDTNTIFTPFKSLYINSDIKLMLAKKDPSGNPINGIVRHIDPKTKWSQATAQSNASYWSYTWDPTRYLNIYLVDEIVPATPPVGGGVIVGYTYKPGSWSTGNAHDAIVYDKDFLSTSGVNKESRSLTHEIGHWLNLAHTFGNTNNPGAVCGDDGLPDTPPTKGNFGSCGASATNTAYTCSSPNPTNSASYFQNIENFMDYSDCPKNFTIDQTTAMRNALASVVSNRQNLWQTSNLNFTNVNGANNFPPIAEFMSTYDTYTVCVGGTLQFKDFSYNGTITGYQWAANDAIIGAPTSSNANITFTAAGISTVSLTVSNTFGSNVKQRVVTVVDNTAGIFGPHFESFEDPGIPIDWHVYDGNNDGLTWAQTPAASYDGAYSFVMENATNPPNSIDILEMPIMDVLNNQGNVFSFAYAYRQKTAGVSDMLRIQASKDCGGTWNDIYALNSSVMQAGSGGISADPYYPMDPSEWKTYVISSHPAWNSYKTSSSVMVRFLFQENSAGNGNNLYVDAINFFPPTGVNELSNMIRYSVYPNPSNDVTNVSFSLHDAAKVKIEVLDVLGKSVMEPIEGSYSQGDHSVVINNNLPTGIYFVNLSLNGAKVSTKLIVE